MVAWLAAAALAAPDPAWDALEDGRTHLVLDEVTPEAYWFHVRFLDAEAASCEVAVTPDAEAAVYGCQFPPGPAHPAEAGRVPRGLGGHARAAVRAVRAAQGPIRRVDVTYEGAFRRVVAREVVGTRAPSPDGRFRWLALDVGWQWRLVQRSSPHDLEMRLERLGMGRASPGEALCACEEPPRLVDWAPPPALDGRSVLWGALVQRDPEAAAALPVLERAVLEAAMAAATRR